MKAKKILFISGLQIYPAESGGQKRSQSICEGLANLGHEVKIMSLTGRKLDYLHNKQTFKQEHYSGVTETVIINRLWGIIGFLAYRLHIPFIWQSVLLAIKLPVMVRNAIANTDLIIFDFPYLMTARKYGSKIPVILNTHNLESELWPSLFWQWLIKKFEFWAFQQADFITFCTNREMQTVVNQLQQLQTQVGVIPNGLNTKDLIRYRNARTKLRADYRPLIGANDLDTIAVFSGSYFGPNIEAYDFLLSFIDTNFQALKDAKIKILIAGSVGRAPLRNDVLTVTGKVDDIYPYLVASDIALNIVESGSGSNVKNFEYLFFRLPIISTQTGARGLLGVSENGPITLTTRNDLYQKIIKLSKSNKEFLANSAYEINRQAIEIEHAIENTFGNLPMFN